MYHKHCVPITYQLNMCSHLVHRWLTWPDMWLTTHVTYLVSLLTHQTTCTDWPDLTCDLPHMWLTRFHCWPIRLLSLTWPPMWLTTHVTYLASCVDLSFYFMTEHDICEANKVIACKWICWMEKQSKYWICYLIKHDLWWCCVSHSWCCHVRWWNIQQLVW